MKKIFNKFKYPKALHNICIFWLILCIIVGIGQYLPSIDNTLSTENEPLTLPELVLVWIGMTFFIYYNYVLIKYFARICKEGQTRRKQDAINQAVYDHQCNEYYDKNMK